jgi:SAM-dependent methyltransferase
MHSSLTKQIVKTYIDPMELPKDAHILDLGCGPGYFLDEMKERGYTNVTGVTLSPGDQKTCTDKGHTIKGYDLTFLPQKDGYYDESVDFIFSRHSLEHSPYPIFTLVEYNRVLKQHGKIYIEMPAPDCERQHEWNLNHYSILGRNQLAALLDRTGFAINTFDVLSFDASFPKNDNEPDGEKVEVKENFYCIVATKQRPLDIK